CSDGDGLKFVGSDGKHYVAKVRGFVAPTGTPKYDAGAVEGKIVKFDANGVAPAGATGPVTYEWRFQKDGCGFSFCGSFHIDGTHLVFDPEYGDPVPGTQVTHTW